MTDNRKKDGMRLDAAHNISVDEQNTNEDKGPTNWRLVVIGLISFLFVVYIIYSQYKANNP